MPPPHTCVPMHWSSHTYTQRERDIETETERVCFLRNVEGWPQQCVDQLSERAEQGKHFI